MTMNDHFAYLVGAFLFDAAWLACYLIGKRYRPQIIWGTAVTAPLALTSFLFVPQYWTPPSLFDLDTRFRVGNRGLPLGRSRRRNRFRGG
jgi:hypothetical protein